jgi:hypothetical protein
MKKLKLSICAGISASAVFLLCASASAGTGYSISFDANGNITGNTANAFPPGFPNNGGPISLGIGNDYGPTGQGTLEGHPLGYSTETPNGMEVSGDLILDMCGHTEDILRFYASGQQYIDVYGASGGTALADVGFPALVLSNLQTPQLTLDETILPDGDWGIVYTPTVGEPGYGGNITFTFDSDYVGSACVPDGGTTLWLLGGAMLVLGGLTGFNVIVRRTDFLANRSKIRTINLQD